LLPVRSAIKNMHEALNGNQGGLTMIDVQKLCSLIEEHQQELFDLLGSLVRINSENFGSHGRECEIAGHIHNLCMELGLASEVYCPMDLEGFDSHPDYLPGRHLEEKRNVTAVWHGLEDRNALMLMGHLDTVEIGDPASWKREPLCGILEDGKIHGRGACDDKYALATVLYLIRLL
jgi:acetylornithine deacetylase/succinyl-diaminopimelate desuccinylase-like protein